MAHTRSTARSKTAPTGLLMVLLGLVAVTLSRPVEGFLGGAFAGGGIALILLGVYQIGATLRPRRDPDGPARSWLPSRDSRR